MSKVKGLTEREKLQAQAKELEDKNKELTEKTMLEFQEQYQDLCEKHGYSFMPVITIKGDGSVLAQMDIVNIK